MTKINLIWLKYDDKHFDTKHVHYTELNIYIQGNVSVNKASWPTVRLRYIQEAQPHNKDIDRPNWLYRYNIHCKIFNIWSVESIYIETLLSPTTWWGSYFEKKSLMKYFFFANPLPVFLRFAKKNTTPPLKKNCIQNKWYLSNEQNTITILML